MGLRAAAMRGGAWLSLGQIGAQALVFVRNLLIARLIGPDDFGIAATFAITVGFFENLSNLNLNKMLIQDSEGESPALQATAHSFQIIRNVVLAGLILACAGPAARVFEVPEATWAFRLLALVPIFRGFAHLDIARFEREMHFMPKVALGVGPELLATIVGGLLLIWVRDFSVMLVVFLVRESSRLLLNHLLAQRPYRWAWDRVSRKRLLAFGLPLLANGLVIFGILEGDRLIVGSLYGTTALGIFAVAFGVPNSICKVAIRLHASLLLPMLAKVQDQPHLFRQRYELALQWLAMLGALLAVVLIFVGPTLVVVCYGEDYRTAGALVGWLGLMQAIRLVRRAPVLAGLARGDSLAVTLANVGRGLWLIAAVSVAWLGWPLVWVAYCGVLGETNALVFSLGLVRIRHGLGLRSAGLPLTMLAASATAALVAANTAHDNWWVLGVGQLLLMALTVAGALLVLSRLRTEMVDITRAVIRREPL